MDSALGAHGHAGRVRRRDGCRGHRRSDQEHRRIAVAHQRSALRVGIHELDRAEVPPEVAIDEAVGYAKRYSSEEAGRLVNGILGRIQREAARA